MFYSISRRFCFIRDFSFKVFYQMSSCSVTEKLETLSNEELIEKVIKLQTRTKQLEGLLSKARGDHPSFKEDQRKQRPIDFSKYTQRNIALKFAYFGWNYSGLVIQQDLNNTVIEKILVALERSKLIENRENCSIKCCGRTDKGVSASSQVISLAVRSYLTNPEGMIPDSGVNIGERLINKKINNQDTEEIDYPHLLNRLLPKDIRILAWAPVAIDFSARFSCRNRTYKYYFPQGNLNISKMQDAASRFVGEHDFRNFCKMDIHKILTATYYRRVIAVSIDHVTNRPAGSSMLSLTVQGSGFLYHQIRCMMAVLILVGQGKEEPQVVDSMLNIKEEDLGKPEYQFASALPLVFYESSFHDITWKTSKVAYEHLVKTLHGEWTTYQIKNTIVDSLLSQIHEANPEHYSDNFRFQTECLLYGTVAKMHKPLLKRKRESTLSEKIAKVHTRKKAKISVPENEDGDEEFS